MSCERVYLVQLWQDGPTASGNGFLSNAGVFEAHKDAVDSAYFHCKAFDDAILNIETSEVKTHIITRSQRRFTITEFPVTPSSLHLPKERKS